MRLRSNYKELGSCQIIQSVAEFTEPQANTLLYLGYYNSLDGIRLCLEQCSRPIGAP